MKFKDFLTQTTQNIFLRKKSTSLMIIIFSILFLIIFLSCTFKKTIMRYIDDFYYKNYAGREYMINLEYDKIDILDLQTKLENIDGIVKVVDGNQRLSYTTIEISESQLNDISFNLFGSDNDILPKIIEGDNFQNNTNKIELICPNNVPIGSYELFETDYIKMNNYINKDVIILIDEYDYSKPRPILVKTHSFESKIVGLYDAQTNNLPPNYCFTTFEVVDKINKINKIGINKSLLIIIDDYRNYDKINNKVINMIKDDFKLNVSLSPMAELDMSDINKTVSILELILLVSIVISIFSMIIITAKNIKKNEKEISTYKAIGYSNRIITQLYTFSNVLIMSLSAIVAFIMTSIFIFIIRVLANTKFYMLSMYNFKLLPLTYLILFLIIIIITIFVSILLFKNMSKKTTSQLYGN